MSDFELEINAGATYRSSFEPATEVDGVEIPYDLTGAMFKMYIRDAERRRFAEYDLTINGERVDIHLPANETVKYYPHRHYYFVIDMLHPNGDVERILDGPLRVRPYTGGTHA